jgi:hypothetical protein
VLLCFFIAYFRKKIDYVVTHHSENKYEDEDELISEQSLMISNIPKTLKYGNVIHHTNALF